MKILGIFLAATLSLSTYAGGNTQPELPLNHPDEVLVKAYPGDSNTRLIELKDIRSKKVREEVAAIDLAFEMGDGYYSVIKSALYMVFDKSGKIVGYMDVALLSYTEDPDVFLVAGYVNARGIRIGEANTINTYSSEEDEEIQSLPEELRP